MFHNYFFLKKLANQVNELLIGKELLECFSQNKDELILGFADKEESTYIRANLIPQISLLQITNEFSRAKKNSVDLFHELIGQAVTSVNVFQYERSFWIDFSNEMSLIFKMHGSRSNILLAKDNEVIELFRSKLENDESLVPSELYKTADLSLKRFEELNGNLTKFLPALGKEVKAYLKEKGIADLDLADQHELVMTTINELESGLFYIYEHDEKPQLSLLKPSVSNAHQSHDAIATANEFYIRYSKWFYLYEAKNKATRPLEDQIKKTQNYIDNTEAKLYQVLDRRGYDEIANIIMANLHEIHKGQDRVTLHDFYTDEEIEIKLNPELSPQKHAENLYRKAKNQNLEVAKLEENIATRRARLKELEVQLEEVRQSQDIKALRKETPAKTTAKHSTNLAYHLYEVGSYQVLVGKNARHNDELTLKVANKNDLWLHAKDVAGSHVVIRHQAGKNIPKDVLEIAAELAAWYSKRKTDSLCPVIYTPKKYIRKRKGDPPGAVVVEKEDIIMVEPKNHPNQVSI
ncbi:NFACT RNA binding domain-containing protein [Marinoscillum sp.]|uniref:NFACT RNA binding domain-containing protein n=1 Tax=Marinoscillum sp. TaxID=2024838 RepID=UPI003BAA4B2C